VPAPTRHAGNTNDAPAATETTRNRYDVGDGRRYTRPVPPLRPLLLLLVATAAGAEDGPPPETVTIRVAATRGEIIPRSRGGGFQRSFLFTAKPGEANHWIRQTLEVRGTVKDREGETEDVHLDIIEYYRVNGRGRLLQYDSHYSVFRNHCAGALTIRSRLVYGELKARKRGDTILGKTFILRSCLDADGEKVTMRTRKGRLIPAEHGERVTFAPRRGALPSRYEYAVEWDACPGSGPRTQPNGTLERGVWWIERPKPKPAKDETTRTKTVSEAQRRPIPRVRRRQKHRRPGLRRAGHDRAWWTRALNRRCWRATWGRYSGCHCTPTRNSSARASTAWMTPLSSTAVTRRRGPGSTIAWEWSALTVHRSASRILRRRVPGLSRTVFVGSGERGFGRSV